MWRSRQIIVFLSALILYLFCLDRGASLWDCPEYILIAWRLEIGHPPGNPTWQLIANVLSHLGGSAQHAAVIINGMSAVAMALAATFLSSIIYLLLRASLFKPGNLAPWASLCGVCGALCYAWCDSAIFSSVEAEVYALSAMFTSLMLLLSLKWAQKRAKGEIAASRRLLILTAYLAGLGVGVHELNFLVLPAMALVYWYGARKYPVSTDTDLRRIFGLRMDGMPTLMWSMILFCVGTSTYLIIPMRAAAGPPINQGDPSSWAAFRNYYGRAQYGSKPFLYGRTPYSKPLLLESYDSLSGKYSYTHYYLRENGYGLNEYVYPKELDMWFPRMTSSLPEDIEFYEAWAGMSPDAMIPVEASVVADSTGNMMGKMNTLTGEREMNRTYRPTYFQQLRYLMGYQVGFMYFRYLLWNYSGRQNNLRGSGGSERGNFITGFPVIDDAMLGPQSDLPPSLREDNVGYNRYFLIPFIFGIFGIIALLCSGKDGRKVCAIIALFFLFTGVLIAVYLNQDPGEVRDRDYSFLGSFMAYSIWIASGMAALVRLLLKYRTRKKGTRMVLRIVSVLVCVGIPLQILSQTYNDHDRSHNQHTAEKLASDIFACVGPGAIVVANGDNAIFPLWYAQEVLGMRRDVSIVAEPYLPTELYRRQIRRPGEGAPGVNISDTIPAGPGSITERAIRNIRTLNPDRPVYRVSPSRPPILLTDSL